MNRAATLEYATQGIRIIAVCPGIIKTPMVTNMLEQEADAMEQRRPMVPAKRLGSPDEVAQAVVWECGTDRKSLEATMEELIGFIQSEEGSVELPGGSSPAQ